MRYNFLMYLTKSYTSDDKFVHPDRIVYCLAKASKEQGGSGSEATPPGLIIVGRKFIDGGLIEYYCNPWDILLSRLSAPKNAGFPV